MAELQLGGKVIATQSDANNPVLASNVVMDNVNVSNALASATFPAGHILQVKSTVVTERASTTITDTSGTGGDVGLNVNIIPKSSNSSFLIYVNVGIGTTEADSWGIILSRDGTKIGNGVDLSNRNGVFFRAPDHAGSWGNDGNHGVGGSNHFLDTTSGTKNVQITFKAGLITQSATAYINRNENNNDVDRVHQSYTSSSITVMEIQK